MNRYSSVDISQCTFTFKGIYNIAYTLPIQCNEALLCVYIVTVSQTHTHTKHSLSATHAV